jgi:hypothetical protein
MTKPNVEAQPCLLRCRCFVKQQDQAVKVRDPVMLAEYFEALIGTSGYVQSIAETHQDISDNVKTSETVQASVSRQARPPPQFVCDMLTPQNDNAFAFNDTLFLIPGLKGGVLSLAQKSRSAKYTWNSREIF